MDDGDDEHWTMFCIPTHRRFHRLPASYGIDQKLLCLRTLATATTVVPDSKASRAQISSNEELATIVHQFPPTVDYAFGYGSGVFRQQSPFPSSLHTTDGKANARDLSTTSSSMIDIILAVTDPYSWHKRNMERHSDHYSALARWGGPRFVTRLQVNFGAKLYFHPFVNMAIDMTRTHLQPSMVQRQIKYGVVSTNDLIHDLVDWEYLYLAGRMHKPTVSIDLSSTNDPDGLNAEPKLHDAKQEVEEAQRINLLSAVSASLLLQPSMSTQILPASHLYNTIASLSYTGDFRMHAGAEDPNKIKKLVETPGMMERWDEVYSETLSNMEKLGVLSVLSNDDASRCIEISLLDRATRKQLVKNLPRRLQKHSDLIVGADDTKSLHNGSNVLRHELANIVSPAAKSQSMKGFLTAGVGKSWKYAVAKFAKGRLRK
jgi:translocator assembly and maintenance protein 41